MARSFVFLNILKEAHDMDLCTSRRQAQNIRNLSLAMRSDEFVHMYRLSEELFHQLENELIPFLPVIRRKGRGHTNRSKLLCTLAFLASGSYQKILGKNIEKYLYQTSISRSIKEIVEVLNHPTITKKYIRFPQNYSERRLLQQRFYEKFHIPGIIGYIDGTFAAILRPHENEERFYCRKGFHARNVMLIVDADLSNIHVDASYAGATHDAFIFNNYIIKDHLEELTNSGEVVYLLGDAGYPQRPYVMTPIAGANESTPDGYNQLHATARNTVERVIGVLKAQFRCLLVHRVLHYHPDVATKILIACCVLHNICNRAGLSAPILSEEELQHEISLQQKTRPRGLQIESDVTLGRNSRNCLVNRLWHSR